MMATIEMLDVRPAEASALGAMVMAGGRQAQAVLVMGQGPDIITPCGGCRQKLREFAGSTLWVMAADPGGVRAHARQRESRA